LIFALTRRTQITLVCITLAATVAAGDAGVQAQPHVAGVSAADEAAILALTQAYRDGWLANDPQKVMATLTRDAVLLPSGMGPIQGEPAIRRFWFPAQGPATTVTRMEQQVLDLIGSGEMAVVSGRGSLAFHMGHPSQTRAQHSWFVNVVTRQPDGRWLIARRMWSDLRR
jgi:uncharacterized protein (TIGR02246 family)